VASNLLQQWDQYVHLARLNRFNRKKCLRVRKLTIVDIVKDSKDLLGLTANVKVNKCCQFYSKKLKDSTKYKSSQQHLFGLSLIQKD
jgi:hypothetical protein